MNIYSEQQNGVPRPNGEGELRAGPRGQLPPHKFSSFTDVCAMWSGSISRVPQLFKGNWAYLLQSVSYQNCIEDCLFLFSYYIFMRGYYRVSTSVFISYFRLRKMTSRLGNDDGHRDGD